MRLMHAVELALIVLAAAALVIWRSRALFRIGLRKKGL
jgi:hypothetical protein